MQTLEVGTPPIRSRIDGTPFSITLQPALRPESSDFSPLHAVFSLATVSSSPHSSSPIETGHDMITQIGRGQLVPLRQQAEFGSDTPFARP